MSLQKHASLLDLIWRVLVCEARELTVFKVCAPERRLLVCVYVHY